MQSLYRLYRPQNFSQLVGQEHISATLLKALETGKVSHAYLFIGPRGTGKTSTARILAKALNCEKNEAGPPVVGWGEPCNQCSRCLAITAGNYLDLLEIDAASNRGIDEIRDLREKIKLAPTQGKYKVYIIDEVHMLTNEAFNALLKTLEEPPPHAIFILCTTDPQKIPTTIRSRCQVYEFKIPTIAEIVKVLEKAVKEESASAKATADKKIKVKTEDLAKIAHQASGAYRDALVLLEKYLITGNLDKDFDLASLAVAHLVGDSKAALTIISELVSLGHNPKGITELLLDWNRKALLFKLGLVDFKKDISDGNLKQLEDYAGQADLGLLKKIIEDLTHSLEDFKYSPIPQLPLELVVIANDSSVIAIPSEHSESREKQSEPENREIAAPADLARNDKKDEAEVIKVKSGDTEVIISTPKSTELETIQSRWIELLRKLRPINHSLEALLRSSEPVEYKDGFLTLKFFYRFHKERVEDPKNRLLVEKVFHEETGFPISLKFLLSDERKPTTHLQASQNEASNVKIVDDKDIGEAALDIFTN